LDEATGRIPVELAGWKPALQDGVSSETLETATGTVALPK
jgi:hypothetical protein